jgi:hypothetical protein
LVVYIFEVVQFLVVFFVHKSEVAVP